MRISFIAVAAVLAAPVAVPAAQAQSATDAKPTRDVSSGTYIADPDHTQVNFTVSHFGFSNFRGQFSGAAGTLQLNVTKPSASSLKISIPIQSVSTTIDKLDDELKGDQWFDAKQFPNATFSSTGITPTANDAATITGYLTLHGVTQPVVLQAHFIGAGVNPLNKAYTIGFEATGTIKRSDFGVKGFLPMVSDEVRLDVSAAFELHK